MLSVPSAFTLAKLALICVRYFHSIVGNTHHVAAFRGVGKLVERAGITRYVTVGLALIESTAMAIGFA